MTVELRPTPVGEKAAKRFYKHMSSKEISDEQEAFIQDCIKVLDDCS